MKAIILLVFVSSVVGVRMKPEPFIEVDKDVRFDLYTLENPNEPQLLRIDDINSVTASNYDPEAPTRIFIHGFQSRGELRKTLTDAYFTRGLHDVNLIGINWEKASNTINYPAARSNVGVIGEFTAKFIDFMIENKMLKFSDLIVIGFSLGAHAAGFSGKNVRSGKLEKIVGLDPAGVLFHHDKPDERLNSTDAKYVETIQTSKLGFVEPVGSVSFFPNGGRFQPTCEWDKTGACSHSACYAYFAQTIYMDFPFFGDLCPSLDAVREEKCNPNQQAIMGGEPGAMEQPRGMYHIRLVPDPDL